MTDDQARIEEAELYYCGSAGGTCSKDFKAGVQWRDKNPSDAVMKMYELLKYFELRWPMNTHLPEVRYTIESFEKELGQK